jgi:hypothetical protein
MAAATMTMEPIIKTAMSRIGLEEKTDDLLDVLDEIELDRRLKISEEQEERGEVRDAREALKEIRERVLNVKKS